MTTALKSIKDHLGNVRVVINDKKTATIDAGVATNVKPIVLVNNNFYTGGMKIPGRQFEAINYRFGYQSSEKDNEINSNIYTTYYRELDSRLLRWWSPDVVTQPWQSPYVSMDNNPVAFTDVLGDETKLQHIIRSFYRFHPKIGRLMGRMHNGLRGIKNNTVSFTKIVRIKGSGIQNMIKATSNAAQTIINISRQIGNFISNNVSIRNWFNNVNVNNDLTFRLNRVSMSNNIGNSTNTNGNFYMNYNLDVGSRSLPVDINGNWSGSLNATLNTILTASATLQLSTGSSGSVTIANDYTWSVDIVVSAFKNDPKIIRTYIPMRPDGKGERVEDLEHPITISRQVYRANKDLYDNPDLYRLVDDWHVQ